MKKIGVLLFILLLSIIAVFAANQTEDNAYSCLENKVEGKCSSLTLEQQAFSLSALSYDSRLQRECKNSIKALSRNDECWPSSSCKIKDTALAIIALSSIGENTEKAEEWLLSRNKTPSDIEFYLEIDSNQEAKCKINYNNRNHTIYILENKKIDSDAGSCLSLSYNNYFLKIKDSCLKEEFRITCDKSFISTILYKKTNSDIWQLSSDTQSASDSGETIHKITSSCFSSSKECDYESSLWAVLALQKTGHDASIFLPYLISLSQDNKKYFPSSFLFILTDSDEYLQEILNSQKSQEYFELGDKGKFYDTALALLSLPDSEAEDNAKDWLLENQDNAGCWNNGNIRDTAFLLFAGFPRTAVFSSEEQNCEPTYYCVTKGECDEASGDTLSSYLCPGLKICCDKPKKQKTCQEESGQACQSGKKCSISTISTLDEDECCLGECVESSFECENSGYNCKSSCSSNEESSSLECPSGEICCRQKTITSEKKNYLWLWTISVLIVILVLLIIFRNRIRLFLFKMRGGSSQDVSKFRPGFPPFPSSGLRRMMPPARIIQPARQTARPRTKTDDELEDTLKKLKEMSK